MLDPLKCLGTCGGGRNGNAWMCDNCWEESHVCHSCGQNLNESAVCLSHDRKPCPEEEVGVTMTATGTALKKGTMKDTDFENEDWWKFLPPSLQEEALASINEKIPDTSDDGHVCADNIDCCDAFRIARDQECSELSEYVSNNQDHESCHDDCLTQDTVDEKVEEIKNEMRRQIVSFIKELDVS